MATPRIAARHIRGFGRYFHATAIPMLAVGSILGGPAIHLLAGAPFADVPVACALLLAASFVEMAAMPWSYVVSAHGAAARSRNATIAGCVGNLVVALALTPVMGIAGAGLAVLAGQIIVAAVNIRSAISLGHAPARGVPWWTVSAAVLAALPACAIAARIPHDTWGGLLLAGAGATAAYAAGFAFLARMRAGR